MTIAEMKNFARENRLRGYTRHRRKDDLITFLRNNYQPAPTPASRSRPRHPTRPPPPPPPPPPSIWLRPGRLRQPELLRQLEESQRQPSSQEMDIFKQQEMSKSWPQVRDKLKEWYNWLVSHVPEPVTEKASRAFKATKDKIMGLYKSFKGKDLY